MFGCFKGFFGMGECGCGEREHGHGQGHGGNVAEHCRPEPRPCPHTTVREEHRMVPQTRRVSETVITRATPWRTDCRRGHGEGRPPEGGCGCGGHQGGCCHGSTQETL